MSEPRPLFPADPKATYLAHAGAINAAIARVLAGGHYILGPEVEAFEREWAAYLGDGYAVGVANGTEALELALRAVGVAAGDRVATVANTVSATAAAIQQIGAEPVFVEIDVTTMTMSPGALAEVLTNVQPIKAVLPVHLYGRPAAMPEIMELARAHGAKVVEDCAQAHGAKIGDQRAGTWGDAAAFSFYPTKNLGALGDGGAVFATDATVADRVRSLRQYGWKPRYVSVAPGRNSRLDELQAAILRVKLPSLDAENAVRASHARRYLQRLAGGPWQLPPADERAKSVWHQFALRSPRRHAMLTHLAAHDIHAGVLYPVPLHHQPAYACEQKLPVTEQACAEVLCLPVHPGLTLADIDRGCDELLRWAEA